jgi:hypothetical protein
MSQCSSDDTRIGVDQPKILQLTTVALCGGCTGSKGASLQALHSVQHDVEAVQQHLPNTVSATLNINQ